MKALNANEANPFVSSRSNFELAFLGVTHKKILS